MDRQREGSTAAERRCPLWFIKKAVVIDNEVWVTAGAWNGLYKIDLMTEEAERIARFDGEKEEKGDLYRDMARWQDKLIMAPMNTDRIAVYDIKVHNMKYICLPKENRYPGKIKYGYCAVYRSGVFFVGSTSDIEIIYLDLNTEQIIRTGCIPGKAADCPSAGTIPFEKCDSDGEKIYIPVQQADRLAVFDMKTYAVEVFAPVFELKEECIAGAACADGRIYLWSKTRLYEWDKKENVCRKILEVPLDTIEGVAVNENAVYISDLYHPHIYYYDRKRNWNLKKIDCETARKGLETSGLFSFIPVFVEGYRYIGLSLYDNKIYEIVDGEIERSFRLETADIPDMNYDEYFQEMQTEGKILEYSINALIHYVTYNEKSNLKKEKKTDETIGEKIFRVTGEIRRE